MNLNTINAVIFAGLIFRVWQHKNIFAGCKIHAEQMLTCHFCTTPGLSPCHFVLHKVNIWQWMIHLQVCNWAAQKQSKSQTDLSILPICINTHGQYTTPTCTCPKCAYKISQIFSRVFEFALAEFARNPRKLMYRKYFRFYSTAWKLNIWPQPLPQYLRSSSALSPQSSLPSHLQAGSMHSSVLPGHAS